jgi:hypothetical protein
MHVIVAKNKASILSGLELAIIGCIPTEISEINPNKIPLYISFNVIR